jgi:hypothetical protein
VLDPDDGDAAAAGGAHHLDQLHDLRVGEAAGDLVQQQQPRPRRQRAGQLQALALQQAELAGEPVRLAPQAGPVEHRGGQGEAPLAARASALLGGDQHVLEHGHVLERPRHLPGPADAEPAADRRVQVGHGQPIEADLAGVRGQLAGDDPEQAGLAGAVGPDDADRVAGADLQRQRVGDRDLAEALGDPVELEQAAGGRHRLVGVRSPPIGTSGFRLLSTTTISNGNCLPFFHCTPSGFWMATPGTGPLVKSSGPEIPS